MVAPCYSCSHVSLLVISMYGISGLDGLRREGCGVGGRLRGHTSVHQVLRTDVQSDEVIQWGRPRGHWSVMLQILQPHGCLSTGTRVPRLLLSGRLRRNWIGGHGFTDGMDWAFTASVKWNGMWKWATLLELSAWMGIRVWININTCNIHHWEFVCLFGYLVNLVP